MSSTAVLAALLVGGGLALAVLGFMVRLRQKAGSLAEILDLPYGEQDVSVAALTERSPIIEGATDFAGRMVEQLDAKGALRSRLERARVPFRPGEYALLTAAGTIVAGFFVAAVTERWAFGLVAGAAVPVAAKAILDLRISRRRRAFEEQLPEALSIIASSLSAGHTFLRAIQMMCEEAEPPISEEFARVVSETRLGDSVVDALERSAQRMQVKDLFWVVQAIRIQQTTGGKLADLLHTLADFIRAREEIRREINVLTAEGRVSAWVLGSLPVFLLLVVQILSPGYMDPLFRGWGPFVLIASGISVIIGFTVIRRMVKIEV